MGAAAPVIVSVITGSTWQAALARFALSVAASFVINKVFGPEEPNSPANNVEQIPDQGVQQRLSTNTSNKLPVVYGDARIYGSITYSDITADNQTMAFLIPLCEGPIEEIGDIYWDNYRLSLNSDGWVSNATDRDGEDDDFLNDNLRVLKFKGGGRCTQMENFSTKWAVNAPNRAMPNVAYLYAELKYDRDKGVTGLSNRFGAEVKGKLVRTITGPNTIGAVAYSNNPAECLLDYLTDKTYGIGNIISDQLIDIPTFYSSKVFCDEEVVFTNVDGIDAITKRFTTNGFVNTSEQRDTAISDLTINSQTQFSYSLGKFQMRPDTISSSVHTFNDDNIYGNVAIVNDGFNSVLNKLEVSYNSRQGLFQDDQVFLNVPQSRRSKDEPELVKNMRSKYNNNNVEVERWATTQLNKSRNNLTVAFQTDLSALALQVGDVVTVFNDTYGFGTVHEDDSVTPGKLFRINSITEAELPGGVPGYSLTCQEYADADYEIGVLQEHDTAANSTLANPRNFGDIVDLTSNFADPNGATPYIDLTWTVPNGLAEAFEIFVSYQPTPDPANSIFVNRVTTSEGTFTPQTSYTYRVFNLEHGENLTFWVRPTNQFARGSFSDAYNYGIFRPTETQLVVDAGVIIDESNPYQPFGIENKFVQIQYADNDEGVGIRGTNLSEPNISEMNYSGEEINTIDRTGGSVGTGTITFDPAYVTTAGINEQETIELTGTNANVLDEEVIHINFADNHDNNVAIEQVGNVTDYDASGFINTGTNSATINDSLELFNLIPAGTLTNNFGTRAVIGNGVAYVQDNTQLFSFRENENGIWNYIQHVDEDRTIISDGNNVIAYNVSDGSASVYSVTLDVVMDYTNIDVNNNIIDFRGGIIVWWNGTEIKYIDTLNGGSGVIEDATGILSLKLLDRNTIRYTTGTEVREQRFDSSLAKNTYAATLNVDWVGATPDKFLTTIATGFAVNAGFDNTLVVRGIASDVDLTGFGTTGTITIGGVDYTYNAAPERQVADGTLDLQTAVFTGTILVGGVSGISNTAVEVTRTAGETGAVPVNGTLTADDGTESAYSNPTTFGGVSPFLHGQRWATDAGYTVGAYGFFGIDNTGNSFHTGAGVTVFEGTTQDFEADDVFFTLEDSTNDWAANADFEASYQTAIPVDEDPEFHFYDTYNYKITATISNVSAQPTQDYTINRFTSGNPFVVNTGFGNASIQLDGVVGQEYLSTDLVSDFVDGKSGFVTYLHTGDTTDFPVSTIVSTPLLTLQLDDGTERTITGDVTYTVEWQSRDTFSIDLKRGGDTLIGPLSFVDETATAELVANIVNDATGFSATNTGAAVEIEYLINHTEINQTITTGTETLETVFSGNDGWVASTLLDGLVVDNNVNNLHSINDKCLLVQEVSDALPQTFGSKSDVTQLTEDFIFRKRVENGNQIFVSINDIHTGELIETLETPVFSDGTGGQFRVSQSGNWVMSVGWNQYNYVWNRRNISANGSPVLNNYLDYATYNTGDQLLVREPGHHYFIYRSLTNDNLHNNPLTDTVNWERDPDGFGEQQMEWNGRTVTYPQREPQGISINEDVDGSVVAIAHASNSQVHGTAWRHRRDTLGPNDTAWAQTALVNTHRSGGTNIATRYTVFFWDTDLSQDTWYQGGIGSANPGVGKTNQATQAGALTGPGGWASHIFWQGGLSNNITSNGWLWQGYNPDGTIATGWYDLNFASRAQSWAQGAEYVGWRRLETDNWTLMSGTGDGHFGTTTNQAALAAQLDTLDLQAGYDTGLGETGDSVIWFTDGDLANNAFTVNYWVDGQNNGAIRRWRVTETSTNELGAIAVIGQSAIGPGLYCDNGTGYELEFNIANLGDIIGYSNHYFVGNNHYLYVEDKNTTDIEWISGTNTQWSIDLGDNYGSILNVPFTPGIHSHDATNEIRNRVLQEFPELILTIPHIVDDINPLNGAPAISGYGLDINLGHTTNHVTSFVINDVNGDGQNTGSFFEYETDASGDGQASVATLTHPNGTQSYSFSIISINEGDDERDNLGLQIQETVNNMTEIPHDFTAIYNASTKVITFNSVLPFTTDPSEKWDLFIKHPGTDADGTLGANAAVVTVDGVETSNYSINVNLPEWILLPYTSNFDVNGVTHTFTGGSDANTAAAEFVTGFNNYFNGYGTATAIDNVVTYTTTIESDLGITFDFSDSDNVTSAIVPGNLGADYAAATKSTLTIKRPDGVEVSKDYAYFNPPVEGTSDNNTIETVLFAAFQELINDFEVTINETDSLLTFTSNDHFYFNTPFELSFNNNGETLTDPVLFTEGTVTQLGGGVPTHYGIRSVDTAAEAISFPANPLSYRWFEIQNVLSDGSINPQYKVEVATQPTFRFDVANQTDNYLDIDTKNPGVFFENVIDVEILTVQYLYGQEVIQNNAQLEPSDLTLYGGNFYVAYKVFNQVDFDAITIPQMGNTILITKSASVVGNIDGIPNSTFQQGVIYIYSGLTWEAQ